MSAQGLSLKASSCEKNAEEIIIKIFFKALHSPESLNLKGLFSDLNATEVNQILEKFIDDLFNSKKVKCQKFTELITLAKKFEKNEDLISFYELIKQLYKHEIILDLKFIVKIFMHKISHMFSHLVEYFNSKTSPKFKIDQKGLNVDEDLIYFYLDYKAAFSFVRLQKIKVPSLKIDMTREISDANSFLIDGLSLVAECYYNQNVDWKSGGQYLHFVYIFEKYIEMFSSLTDFYYIVFFHDLDKLLQMDRSFYLALNIIYNHWQNLQVHGQMWKQNSNLKIKFFGSVSDKDYETFLSEERPTFIVIDESSLQHLNLSDEIKSDLTSVYEILKIFHASQEMKFLFIKELSIKSNRLNGFYGSLFNPRKFYNILRQLKYEKEFENLGEITTSIRVEWKKFAKKLVEKSSDEIKKIYTKLGPKLTFYCLSLVWCAIHRKVSDSTFGSLMFYLIIQSYLQNKLDLKSRALRLNPIASELSNEYKDFLDDFKGVLAFLTQCKSFENIKMDPKSICDIFDGRLFYFCLQTNKSQDSFWKALFQMSDFHSMSNCFINTLRLILLNFPIHESSEFIQQIDMGTLKASPEEIYEIFISFENSNPIKKTPIESVCFSGKQRLVPLQVNSSSHPLFKTLLDKLYCTYEQTNGNNFPFKNVVKEFVNKNKWVDTFNTRKFAVNNNYLQDEMEQRLAETITQLNVNSIRLSNQGTPQLNPSRDTQHLAFLHLNQLFGKVKNSVKSSEDLSHVIRLMVRADFIWRNIIEKKYESPELTSLVLKIVEYLNLTELSTQMKELLQKKCQFNEKENFNSNSENNYHLPQSFIRFQMDVLGDYLVNEREKVEDNRSKIFTPDKWQVKFMDVIDKNESIIITAPTSSGKTYASFYAMEKVVKNWNSDSVLVYVSPTKALVNQTAYAIMDKFGHYKVQPNKTLCGVFTRDFKNNLMSAKILVTVPECLKILIMNYAHEEWVKSIEYVVFDEIHTMGGEINTDVWEHLFLLTTFPFIALSATISNAKKIYRWLENLQNYRTDYLHSKKIHLIEHSLRHNDFKRFIYTSNGFKVVHPVGCLNVSSIEKYEKLPPDLHLSARETLQFYDALKKAYPKSKQLQDLDPEYTDLLKIKPSESLFVTRKSVKMYEEELKKFFLDNLLQAENSKDSFKKKSYQVISSLKISFESDELYPRSLIYKKSKTQIKKEKRSPEILSFIDLVLDLKKQDLLPCIVFMNNRVKCEKYANEIENYLEESEQTLFNQTSGENQEDVDKIFNKIAKEEFPSMINVGVGWHHSGLSKNKKAIVEALFRIGKIKLILATATLALGIHMPCKTVVFMDDSIYLDSFQYRQASGRAGRRGFDQNGNVVFFDIGLTKLERLVGSFIPEIRPHFPLSVTFSMSFFDSEFRKSKQTMSVECLLNKSFWNYSYQSKVSQVHYDAVFSLNFLMDMQLLNEKGKFSLFSNLLERIHYHEPSNFVLYYLFVNGNFHKITESSNKAKKENEMEKVMLILCHLFNQHPQRKESKNTLQKLSGNEEETIRNYNSFVLKSFTNFFIHLSAKLKEKSTTDLNELPLSKMSFTNEENPLLKKFMKKWTYDDSFGSTFAALSGVRDESLLSTKSELFFNCLSILHIDSKIIPIFPRTQFLSDYAFRFFRGELCIDDIKDQGILVGDLVGYLKDFKTVLFSINSCLRKIAPERDSVSKVFENLCESFEEQFIKLTSSMIRFETY